MMKYLLDTNVLRHYTDGHQTLLDNLAKAPLEQVVVPFIVFAEQMRGRYDALLKAEPQNLLREQERLIGTQAVLSAFSILYLDHRSVEKLIESRQKRGTRKRYADVIIAAIALAGGHIVITRNVADFGGLLPAATEIGEAKNKARSFLNSFMDLRNRIAHPSVGIDWPAPSQVRNHIDFFETLAQAISEVTDIYEIQLSRVAQQGIGNRGALATHQPTPAQTVDA